MDAKHVLFTMICEEGETRLGEKVKSSNLVMPVGCSAGKDTRLKPRRIVLARGRDKESYRNIRL